MNIINQDDFIYNFFKLKNRRMLYGLYCIYNPIINKIKVGYAYDFYNECLKFQSIIGEFYIICFKQIRKTEIPYASFNSSLAYLKKEFLKIIKNINKNIEFQQWIDVNIDSVIVAFENYHKNEKPKGSLYIFSGMVNKEKNRLRMLKIDKNIEKYNLIKKFAIIKKSIRMVF